MPYHTQENGWVQEFFHILKNYFWSGKANADICVRFTKTRNNFFKYEKILEPNRSLGMANGETNWSFLDKL